MSGEADALDRALGGADASDAEIAALVDLGSALTDRFAAATPPTSTQRALFVSGIEARGAASGWVVRLLSPALAGTAIVGLVALLSLQSAPGQALYRVREALEAVGLAPSAAEEVDKDIAAAARKINLAEDRASNAPLLAERLVQAAFADLDDARELLGELDAQSRAQRLEVIHALTARGTDILDRVREALSTPGDENDGGPGTGDDDGDGDGRDDDNSGPGGDGRDERDDRGDESGPDDDDDDDKSGPNDDDDKGDGGSGPDDDDGKGSSGPGSGSDKDDSDNSGKGGGDEDDEDDDPDEDDADDESEDVDREDE